MAEQDHDKPRWEPPPWEADAFDAIRRQREAEEADAEIAAALEELEAEPAREQSAPAAADGSAEEPLAVPSPAPVPAEASAPAPDIDAKVEAMLIHLKVEEPDATRNAWVVGALGSVFVGVLGLVMTVWGLVAFAKVGNVVSGGMAAGILILFGMGFVALAAWLMHRTLKFKGVV